MASEKIKVEGIKRRKRRMKLKAKGNSDAIIEKFSAQSSKQAKYAKTTVRKRDASEPAPNTNTANQFFQVKKADGAQSKEQISSDQRDPLTTQTTIKMGTNQ